MSLWSRLVNVFRNESLNQEIDEELESHIAYAIEDGRDPEEARRALGAVLLQRERSRDVRLIPWLDSIRADALFAWRQFRKNKAVSAAAILSLGLAIGGCLSAFRLIDAMLLRPLPIAGPEGLYVLTGQFAGLDGSITTNDRWTYPMFRQMRALVKSEAELIAISGNWPTELTYESSQKAEKAFQQYVSGWMFKSFGIRPALGRVFTEKDDLIPGGHPYAVLSYDYWSRRFGQDPNVIGRSMRISNDLYQIVGVAQKGFTGTEPGTMTDLFVPTMMIGHNAIGRSDYRWFSTYVKLKPGVRISQVREKLRSAFRAFLEESIKALPGMPQNERKAYLSQILLINRAAAGTSGMQREYGKALIVLGLVVMLVLAIACANVANLLTAQGASRGREMALRISIGAGRWRLVQMVLIECAWLAFLGAGIGALFAWWSAPFVVDRVSTADNPVQLVLPADWRVLGFGIVVALGVTFAFGLAPALRASAVKPGAELKGDGNPHARSRLMNGLIGAQVAFSFLIIFVAGLFLTTSDRLVHQWTGFSGDGVLTLETITSQPQPSRSWEQVADHLRAVPGVDSVAISEWPLMTGGSWSGFISVNGAPPNAVASYFLSVTPSWLKVMKIPLLEGRDFQSNDKTPGAAIVNKTFARQYFGVQNPVGKYFEAVDEKGQRNGYRILGLAGDARYKDMREPIQPTAYFPLSGVYSRATFIVRASRNDPRTLSQGLRVEVARARLGFRVSSIRTQAELIAQHTIRERLLAKLGVFFATLALLLSGVGLYGVLTHLVLQRRRDIAIRMAVGAPAGKIAWGITFDALIVLSCGAVAGGVLGATSIRYIDSLLFGVKANDVIGFIFPALAILAVAVFATLPAVVRALHIDPVTMLHSE
jgi:predicted permease